MKGLIKVIKSDDAHHETNVEHGESDTQKKAVNLEKSLKYHFDSFEDLKNQRSNLIKSKEYTEAIIHLIKMKIGAEQIYSWTNSWSLISYIDNHAAVIKNNSPIYKKVQELKQSNNFKSKTIEYFKFLEEFANKSAEINTSLKKLVKRVFLQYFGNVMPLIPRVAFQFYNEYFNNMSKYLEHYLLNDDALFFDGVSAPHEVYIEILTNSNFIGTISKNERLEIFKKTLKGFTITFFKLDKSDYPILGETSYFIMDPISRQAIRNSNRSKFNKEFQMKFKLGKNQSLRTILQGILENTEIFSNLAAMKSTEDVHYCMTFDLIKEVLSLGLLDSHDCDALLINLDFFIEFPRSYARKLKIENENVKMKREQIEEQKRNYDMIKFTMRYQMSVILLHILTIYCDDGFSNRSLSDIKQTEKSPFVFQNEYRFKGIMTIFTNFVASQSFRDDLVETVSTEQLTKWNDFKKNCVQIMTFLNDEKYDLFMKSLDLLKIQDKKSNESNLYGKWRKLTIPENQEKWHKGLQFLANRVKFLTSKRGFYDFELFDIDELRQVLRKFVSWQDCETYQKKNLEYLIELEEIIGEIEILAKFENVVQPSEKRIISICINETRKAGLSLESNYEKSLNPILQTFQNIKKFYSKKNFFFSSLNEIRKALKQKFLKPKKNSFCEDTIIIPEDIRNVFKDFKSKINLWNTMYDPGVMDDIDVKVKQIDDSVNKLADDIEKIKNSVDLIDFRENYRNFLAKFGPSFRSQDQTNLETENYQNSSFLMPWFIIIIDALGKMEIIPLIKCQKNNENPNFQNNIVNKESKANLFNQMNLAIVENSLNYEDSASFYNTIKKEYDFDSEKIKNRVLDTHAMYHFKVNNLAKQILTYCISIYTKFYIGKSEFESDSKTEELYFKNRLYPVFEQDPTKREILPQSFKPKIIELLSFVIMAAWNDISIQKMLFEIEDLDKMVRFTGQSESPKYLYSYSVLCYFEPLLFVRFIFQIFKCDFEIFLWDGKCFETLFNYYMLVFNQYREFLERKDSNFGLGKNNKNIGLFKAMQIWNYLIYKILLEYLNRDNYSNGHHQFIRVSNSLNQFVKERIKHIKPETATQKFLKLNRELFDFKEFDSKMQNESIEDLEKTTFMTFLKLFGVSITNFSKIKDISPLTVVLNSKKKIFDQEIDIEKLDLRSAILKIYNYSVNFAKNNIFNEYQCLTSRPDISIITEKFKVDDMNQIFSIDNLEFFLNETTKIINAIKKYIGRLTSGRIEERRDEVSQLTKYFAKSYLPSIYRLFRGIENSFFTKIEAVDFDGFYSSIKEIVELVIYLTKTFQFIYNPKIKKHDFKRLIGDPLYLQGNTILRQKDDVATSMRNELMGKLNKEVKKGIYFIKKFYLAMYKFYCDWEKLDKSQATEDWIFPATIAKNNTDRLVFYYVNIIMKMKDDIDDCVFETILSYRQFYTETKPVQDWKNDKTFQDFIKKKLEIENRNQLDLKKNSSGSSDKVSETDKTSTVTPSMKKENQIVRVSKRLLGKTIKKKENESSWKDFPDVYRDAIQYYIESKKKEEARNMKETSWKLLFSEDLSAPTDIIQTRKTEKLENLDSFCMFLIGMQDFMNLYYSDDIELSLTYFDTPYIEYVINFDYLMRVYPNIKERCNEIIKFKSRSELRKRRDNQYNVDSKRRWITQENFFEVYFNLLNLMYWRLNDKVFRILIRQFNAVNQLMRLIENFDQSSGFRTSGNSDIGKNPIAQILSVLKFLTENSRIHLNDGFLMDFTDRKQDFPIYAVLLNNLTSLIKSFDKRNFEFDSSYITYLNNIMTRKDIDLASGIYVIQYNGIKTLEAFLMKWENNVVTKIWNNIDYQELYKHMIWLIKMWMNQQFILVRLNKLQKVKKDQAINVNRQSSNQNHFSSFRGSIGGRQTSLIERDNDEELKGTKEIERDFAAKQYKRIFFGKSEQDIDEIMTDELLNNAAGVLRKFSSVKKLINRYVTTHNPETNSDYALSTAIGIYIFLKNLSCKISTISKFLQVKEGALKEVFTFRGQLGWGIEKDLKIDDNTKSEYLILSFLMKIVKRIEVVGSVDSSLTKNYLTRLYFPRLPISFMRDFIGRSEIEEGSPYDTLAAQRLDLINRRDDIIEELEIYQDTFKSGYHRILCIYIFVKPSWTMFWYFLNVTVLFSLNVLMIIFLIAPDAGSSVFNYRWGNKWTVNAMGIVFIVSSGINFYSVVLKFFIIKKISLVSKMKEKEKRQNKEKIEKSQTTIWQKSRKWVTEFIDYKQIVFLTVFLFSFLGLFVSEVFWTLSTMILLMESRFGRGIASGVIIDLPTLGRLFFLMSVILLMTAYILFQWFNDGTFKTVYSNCPNYLYCFVNTFQAGYRSGGGVGDFVENVVDGSSQAFWKYFFMAVLYFLFIKQILFNIVFGLIQDNFGSARSEEESKQDRANFCYICDTERWVIEIGGASFKNHKKVVHNRWYYQDYLFYLKKTPYIKLSSQDLNIQKKIDQFDFSWMPTGEFLADLHEQVESKFKDEGETEITDDKKIEDIDDDDGLIDN